MVHGTLSTLLEPKFGAREDLYPCLPRRKSLFGFKQPLKILCSDDSINPYSLVQPGGHHVRASGEKGAQFTPFSGPPSCRSPGLRPRDSTLAPSCPH
jgi:hypothetical protein